MRLYSYVVEHDLGFAPNPFHGLCTLAACKPDIRRQAQVSDYIVGTGTKHNELTFAVLYWMQVSEILEVDDYWSDDRFRRKRPLMNGSFAQRYGDNIYHRENGEIIQIDSFHSHPNGVPYPANIQRDTGKTTRILVGKRFAYYGIQARAIPDEFHGFIKKGPGHRSNFDPGAKHRFVEWLEADPARGFIDEPTDWPKTSLVNTKQRDRSEGSYIHRAAE
ncbi:MAG TPA: hypothetical protein VN155_13285 [Devosia sp.]|nr:hypothetical protein [Devosia sp.]